MANLLGRLQGNRGQTTRLGSSTIYSELETWNGSIETHLDKDGTFRVFIGRKNHANILIAEGNVDNLTAHHTAISAAYPYSETVTNLVDNG